MKTKTVTTTKVSFDDLCFSSLNRRYTKGLIEMTGWTKAHQPASKIKTDR